MSVKRISGDSAPWGVFRKCEQVKPCASCGADGAAELVAVGVGDGAACREALFGGLAVRTIGDASVGAEPCGFQVIECPVSGSAVAAGEVVGKMFDNAVARFAGAVVAGQVGRREQQQNAMLGEELAHGVGGEGRAIVGFEDEWWSVRNKETEENGDGGVRIIGVYRVGTERAASGEIADGEDFGALAVNGCGRAGVIHGPDGASALPGEGAVPATARDAGGFGASTMQQAGEIAARQMGEMRVYRRHAHFGAVQGKKMQDVEPLAGRGDQRWCAQGMCVQAIVGISPSSSPLRERGAIES